MLRDKVVEVLTQAQEPLTVREIHHVVGGNPTSIHSIISRLLEDGTAIQKGGKSGSKHQPRTIKLAVPGEKPKRLKRRGSVKAKGRKVKPVNSPVAHGERLLEAAALITGKSVDDFLRFAVKEYERANPGFVMELVSATLR